MAIYYVSLATAASDSNDGLTPDVSPFRTIRKGVSVLTPGDWLYLRGGIFLGEENTINSQIATVPSGTSWSAPITIAGYPGEVAVIQPPGNASAVKLTTGAPHHLLFQDLTVDGVNGLATLDSNEGVFLNSSPSIRFRRVRVCRWPIFGVHGVDADTVEWFNCEIDSNGYTGSPATVGHGAYVTANNWLFDGCDIHNNSGYGLHVYNNAGPHTTPSNTIVRRSRLRHNAQYGLVFAWGDNNVAHSNLVYGNAAGGLRAYTGSTNTGLYFNSVFGNGGHGIEAQFYGSATVRSNISFGNAGDPIKDWGGGTFTEDHNFTFDPMFTDPSTGDFSLQVLSSAAGKGVPVPGITTDFAGNPRDASTPAAGAYEIGSLGSPFSLSDGGGGAPMIGSTGGTWGSGDPVVEGGRGAPWQMYAIGLTNSGGSWGPVGACALPDKGDVPGFVSVPGVIDQFYVTIGAGNNRPESIVSLSVNGIPKASVVIPAGTSGVFTDLSSRVPVVRGDLLTIDLTTPLDPPHFISIDAVCFQFTALDPTLTVTRFTASGETGVIGTPVGGPIYVMPIGQFVFSTNDDSVEFHPGATDQPGTLQQASVYIGANSLDKDTTITLRSNRADTPITITVPAGASGQWFHDATHTFAVDGSQTVDWKIDIDPTATGVLGVHVMQFDFTSQTGVWAGGLGQHVRGVGAGTSTTLTWGGLNLQGSGPSVGPIDGTILGLGAYVLASGVGATFTFTVNGEDTSLVLRVPAGFTGYIKAAGVADVTAGALWGIRIDVDPGVGAFDYWCIDFIGSGRAIDHGVIGPLAWGHFRRRRPDGSIYTDTYSDDEMSCPPEYHRGYKAPLIDTFGDAERVLSDAYTGEWQGSTFRVTTFDPAYAQRQQLASDLDKFWTEPCDFYMTSRDNRRLLGKAYPVFTGVHFAVKPARPLGVERTFTDIVARTLVNDENQIPWRKLGDGIVGYLDAINEHLDLDTPEPIVYGERIRLPADPASEQGLALQPILIGKKDGQYLLVNAGHACAEITGLFLWDGTAITDVTGNIGTDWTVPGWLDEPKYEDWRSKTYNNMRRYSIIRGTVGNADPDAVASGEKKLLVKLYGKEIAGDGSGPVMIDAFRQYLDFVINNIANSGRDCQHTVPLTIPLWAVYGVTVPIVDVDSFMRCSAIAAQRYPIGAPRPSGGTYPPGWLGSAVIGVRGGNPDRDSARRWIADFNRSHGTRSWWTVRGQFRIMLLHPTEDIKASAPMFADDLDIVRDSFDGDLLMSVQANRQPFSTDYDDLTGVLKTNGVVADNTSVRNYAREITAATLDCPFAPGSTQAAQRAIALVKQRSNPPKAITLETTVGPDRDDKSLAYLEPGDYFRYRAYPAIATSPTQIRLAMAEKIRIRVSARRVAVSAIDVDDLLGFDAYVPPPDAPAPGEEASGCSSAFVLVPGLDPPEFAPYSNVDHVDTSGNPTDTSVAALLASKGVTAKKARWYKGTAPLDARLFCTTFGSAYGTFLAIFTGACGSLAWAQQDDGSDAYSDHDGALTSSVIEIPVTMGTAYYILVGAIGGDGGALDFGAQFFLPSP